MFLVRRRHPRRGTFQRELALIDPPLLRMHGRLEPLLDVADGFEIFIQPDAVGSAPLAAHRFRAIHHQIQHAGVVALQRNEQRWILRIDA